MSDLPCTSDSTAEASPETSFDATTSAASAAAAENLAAELDSITCSPMDQDHSGSSPLATLVSYGLEPPELLGFMKPEKGTVTGRNGYEDYFPYDSATGQMTGSFFPNGTNVDLDLGYFWGDPIC